MTDKRRVPEDRLIAQSLAFGVAYLEKRGQTGWTVPERLQVYNAALAGFFAGVRYTEDHPEELYDAGNA